MAKMLLTGFGPFGHTPANPGWGHYHGVLPSWSRPVEKAMPCANRCEYVDTEAGLRTSTD